MEVNEIVQQLSRLYTELPREAVQEAVRQQEAVTPVFLNAMDALCEKCCREKPAADDPDRCLVLYGCFILSQFRETKAFPKLMRLLSLDKDCLTAVFGDALPHCMGSFLYSTWNGDVDAALAFVQDTNRSAGARAGVLNLLLALFRDGRLSRKDLCVILIRLMRNILDGDDDEVFVFAVTDTVLSARLTELSPDVEELCSHGQIQREECFEDSGELIDLSEYTGVPLIKDALEEMNPWCMLQEEEFNPVPIQAALLKKNMPAETKPGDPSDEDLLSWKVGRNDPCPCGSGKKFKKCCFPKQQALLYRMSH